MVICNINMQYNLIQFKFILKALFKMQIFAKQIYISFTLQVSTLYLVIAYQWWLSQVEVLMA